MASQLNCTKHLELIPILKLFKSIYIDIDIDLDIDIDIDIDIQIQIYGASISYKALITLLPKPDKDTTKKRTTGQYLMNTDAKKTSTNYLQVESNNTLKKNHSL